METDVIIDRVKKELLRAFDNTRVELDRIEILAAGLAAFNGPIPNYEPTFHHLPQMNNAHELTTDDSRT
jgi:hypothetical protein